jgi:hypothetical protein
MVGATSPWDLLAAAERTANANVPTLPKVKPNMSEADWQAFDRQWCLAMQPLRTKLQSTPTAPPELLDGWLPPQDEYARTAAQLADRTGKALLSRSDTRSRAVGLWWLGSHHHAPSQQRDSILQLVALAESTRDPMAVALAAQAAREPALRRRAVALWQEIEPSNVAPLLLSQAQDKLPAETLLTRVANATVNRNWLNEAFQTVYSVPPPTPGGYAEFVHQVTSVGVAAAMIEPISALIRPCKRPESPQRADQCAKAAQRMWELQPNSLFAAFMAVTMVRAQPTLHAQWADRARSVEAKFGLNDRLSQASIDDVTRRAACLPSPLSQGLMVDRLTHGDWAYLQAQLPTDPSGIAELAAEYRSSRGGRGLLEPQAAPITQPATPR